MQLTDVPAQAAGVVSRVIDGEAVLVHPGQGRVRVLNPVGALGCGSWPTAGGMWPRWSGHRRGV